MSYSAKQLLDLLELEARKVLGEGQLEIRRLGGDASNRIYHRLKNKGQTAIVMELGDNPNKSEEASGGQVPIELPFINMQKYLSAGGVSVPEVFAYLPQVGLLLLEDLGDELFENKVKDASMEERRAWYRRAIDVLISMQQYADGKSSGAVCFERKFDFALLRWELDHFREWLLEADRQVQLSSGERQELDEWFDRLAHELAAVPQGFVHRDFQSRNLMVQPEGKNKWRLRVIDFQDALVGPRPYDLVALLRDSYVNLGVTLVEDLVEYYINSQRTNIAADDFRRAFWLQSVQRKLKDAGRFVFIDRVKKNPNFLKHIPNSLAYVSEAWTKLDEYLPLAELLGKHIPELRIKSRKEQV